MMKPTVMHLIAAMNIAGAEKVVMNLLSQKEVSPYELKVTSFVRVSDDAGMKFINEVSESGVVTDQIPIRFGWDIRDIFNLLRIIRRHKVRLLHTHGYKSDIVGIIAGKLAGVPVVATAHGFIGDDTRLRRNEKLGLFFLRYAGKVISVSDNVRELLEQSGVPSRKIISLPNAIDFSYFTREADIDFRAEWGTGSNEILVGSAGRLSSEKAHTNLIKAFAALPENLRNGARLVIAGIGPCRESICQTAEDFGLRERLIMAGFVRDMRSFYRAIDIFCLPSLTEGLPLSFLEAAASGKAVMASRVGSLATLIENNKDGFLVEAGNVEELTAGLTRLIESEEIRNSMGRTLREKLKSGYDIDNWAKRIFELYGEFIKQ